LWPVSREIFQEKIVLSGEYTSIGAIGKREPNEIDIVAIDDMNKKTLIAEVKMKKQASDLWFCGIAQEPGG
jgi:hypothetical protein